MGEPYIGPTLPPHLLDNEQVPDESDANKEKIVVIGPVLPSNFASSNEESALNDTYGPSLPAHLTKTNAQYSSDDDDTYGPLPAGETGNSYAQQALEERALQIKLGYLEPGKDETKNREEWMLELPKVGGSKLGLGPRQFRKNAGPDFSDRSSWTDTPQEKSKKTIKKQKEPVDLKKEAELREIQKRDSEQALIAKQHNSKKKRDKSLLDLHQDTLKKQKLEDNAAGVPTRRPFNRDIDLKVNQFDDAQKKSIIKKAMHLDDRFSSGQSKFL